MEVDEQSRLNYFIDNNNNIETAIYLIISKNLIPFKVYRK